MSRPHPPATGLLDLSEAASRPDLLAPSVRALLAELVDLSVWVAPIEADLADTAAFCQAYDVPLARSANCVIVAGKRDGETRWAAAVVLATTRVEVNTVVRRRLDVRKVSFAGQDEAVSRTGMEYGGITPIGLPAGWPILIDAAVVAAGPMVVGAGRRAAKVVIDGADLLRLPDAELVEGLGSTR